MPHQDGLDTRILDLIKTQNSDTSQKVLISYRHFLKTNCADRFICAFIIIIIIIIIFYYYYYFSFFGGGG